MAQVDQLLEEYLRVINAKDAEIHELLRVMEGQKCDGKRKDEAHKSEMQKTNKEFDRMLKKMKAVEQKNRAYQERIDELVRDNEALTTGLRETQHRLIEVENTIENNERAHNVVLMELQQSHSGEVSRLAAERDELKVRQSDLQKQLGEAIKSVEECKRQEEQIRKQELRIVELTQSLEGARGKMQLMVPAERVKQILNEHEEELCSLKRISAEEYSDIAAQLSSAQKSGRKMKDKVRGLKESCARLQGKLDDTARELEEVRQVRLKEHEVHNEALLRQQGEVEKASNAAALATEKLCAVTRELRQSEVDLQAMEQRWKEASAAIEEQRKQNAQERERMNSQLSITQARLSECESELSRLQAQVEQGAAKLKECQDALTSAKEAGIRAAADSREALALVNSERDRLREDRNRLVFELKEAEHQLSMEKDRASEVKRDFSNRVEDAAHAMERLREQLKDKEHQLQLLLTTHEKRVQELSFEHTNKLGDCKSQRKTALDDIRRQLEAANLRLTEEVASNKALQGEVKSVCEALASTREESDRWRKEARDNVHRHEVAMTEISELRTSLAKQQELLAAASERERNLHQVAEQVRREKEVETKQREFIERTLEEVKKEAVARRNEAEDLRSRIEKVSGHIVVKELVECEARLRESQRSIEQLQREIVEVQRGRETLRVTNGMLDEKCRAVERSKQDIEDELRRIKCDIQSKEAECARVAQHAREVEGITKQSCEQLEREITQREATIATLQEEISTLLEERTKVAVLEERLQHQTEVARRDSEALQARVKSLERNIEENEEQLREKQSDMLRTAGQLESLQERAVELEGLMAQKEKKHVVRKEALRKALQQMDEVNQQRSELERHLAKVEASREEESRVHRAEALKQEKKIGSLLEKQREMERQLAVQEKEIKDATHEQAALQQRLAVVRDREQVNGAKHAEEQQVIREELNAVNQELSRARAALKAMEEEKSNSMFDVSGVQRRTTVISNRLLISYVEDALTVKEMFGDFIITFTTRLFRGVNKVTTKGCDRVQACMRECAEEAEKKELKLRREIEEMKFIHVEEMNQLGEEYAKEIARQTQQHSTELEKLRREMADASARALQDVEDTLKEYRRKEEQFHREKTELECTRVEMSHQLGQIASLKDQLRALEQRMEAERSALEQEKRLVQQQYERVCRRLDECTAGHNKCEAELRELRCELANTQQALHEKEKTLLIEREKNAQAAYQLEAVSTAKEMLYTQLNDANRKMLNIKQQLLSSRQEAQQSCAAATAERQRLEERISDLTKSLSVQDIENRRLASQIRGDENRSEALERELAECRKREADLSCQLHARKLEISSLKEHCANLESLKNINDITLSETRAREKNLFEKIEEMRGAQQLMQLCFDKQQEQLEAGRRMYEEESGRRDFVLGGVE